MTDHLPAFPHDFGIIDDLPNSLSKRELFTVILAAGYRAGNTMVKDKVPGSTVSDEYRAMTSRELASSAAHDADALIVELERKR